MRFEDDCSAAVPTMAPLKDGDYTISGLPRFAQCCSFRFSRPLGFPWQPALHAGFESNRKSLFPKAGCQAHSVKAWENVFP